MRLPPRWFRRLFIGPAVVALVVLASISLPIWLIVALFISRYVPGKWRILRVAWFLFLYLATEAVGLIALFVLWVGSGFGWKIHEPRFQEFHYGVWGRLLRVIVRSAKVTFKLSIYTEGPTATTAGSIERRPALMLSRHAGPGDSLLLMESLSNQYHRRTRIVMKEFLQWDPLVDVILNRVPSAFVPVGRKGGDPLIRAIGDLAAGMGKDDAFVIFPEGANYTPGRRVRAIQKLREIGRPDLAERAENLEKTLPPKTTGVKTALAAAPPGSDVFFVGHAGLEGFLTPKDIWRGMPMDTEVLARIWHVKAEDIPPPEEQEGWLFDMWATIDQWIKENLSETGELAFDDPDAY